MKLRRSRGLVIGVVLVLAVAVPFAVQGWDFACFGSAVRAVPLADCRVLCVTEFSDSGDYSGGVRLNYVLDLVGGREEILGYEGHLRKSLPRGFAVATSELSRFQELNRRGVDRPEYCAIVHVTLLRGIRWYDVSHWMD